MFHDHPSEMDGMEAVVVASGTLPDTGRFPHHIGTAVLFRRGEDSYQVGLWFPMSDPKITLTREFTSCSAEDAFKQGLVEAFTQRSPEWNHFSQREYRSAELLDPHMAMIQYVKAVEEGRNVYTLAVGAKLFRK